MHRELTLRGLLLGVFITLIFTAANVYFGLKTGQTFGASIPAAIISMVILRRFAGSSVKENNIVQTVASAAGPLATIIFVLPGLVMIGWWSGFPYAVSSAICALGGILGVLYSIPLRRALVTHSNLRFPEGVACAAVLRVGGHEQGEGRTAPAAATRGLRSILFGSIASAGFALLVATQVFASDVAHYFRLGSRSAVTGFDFSLSVGLFAVGHLIGPWVGMAFLVGALIGWGGVVPYLTSLAPAAGDAAGAAMEAWSHQVRFIGTGAIAVAAIWTLIRLIEPVLTGLSSAFAAARIRKAGQGAELPRTEQDIPIGIVGAATLICMLPIAWLLANFSAASGLGSQLAILTLGGIVYVALMSFFVAAVCGYMAGLFGSSMSPLSGVGILVVVGAALLLTAGVKSLLPASAGPALVAFALFVTSVIFAVAAISNDNLQDLKTGHLVDATPWRQQVALIVGVIAGSLVIPPILDLLNLAYGFAGSPGVIPGHALPAPQAALISALAQGVIQGDLPWGLIGKGALIGIAVIIVDEVLRRTTSAQLPPLAVGIAIYLPTATILMAVVGAFAGSIYERRARHTADPAEAKQLGVLLASGMLVGESLIGILLAVIVVLSGRAKPLAVVGDDFSNKAVWLGGLAFTGLMIGLYTWLNRMSGPATKSKL